jgi:Tfp pilus assembly protein PilF
MSSPELDAATIAEPGQERSLVDTLLEMGWLLAAILVPLSVNLWAQQPFEPAKAALLRSLTWIMAGLWLADGLLARHSPWRELRHNPLLWPALAVAGSQILATILAVDPRLSLYGSYERAQGALTLLSYPLLFLVVAARLRTPGQARRLATAMVATAVPLVGLGLAQALGRDPLGLLTDARSPIYTTLGRSNFTGAYLAMLLPLTVSLWPRQARLDTPKDENAGLLTQHLLTPDHSPALCPTRTVVRGEPKECFQKSGRRGWSAWQWVAGGLAVAELGVIGLTLARGAWLAAAVSLGVMGLLWFWPRLGKWPRWVALAGGALGLVAVLSGSLWLSREGGSEAARLAIWRATATLIARRPLAGYGPEALGLVFPSVYPPQLVYYQGRGVAVDRAHNLFLDWTVAGGVPALVAGLALLAAFFVLGWRAARRAGGPERRAVLIGCVAAVAGNVAGNLVSFDVTATATAVWLLMAIVAAGENSPSPRPSSPGGEGEQARQVGQGAGLGRWAAVGLVVAGIGVAMIQANVRPLAAGVSARAAADRAAAGDWAGAIAAQERAVALWPVEPAHHLALSWDLLQQAQRDGRSALPWLQRAEAELLAARDLRPGDFRTWAALSEMYGLWANRWDAAKLGQAEDAYRQATALAPNNAMLYTAWGMVYQERRQFVPAAAMFRRAADLDATDGYAQAHLGDAELAQGHPDEALTAYLQAVHWEPGLTYAHLGLARCYWQLGRRQEARASLEQVLQLDPGNATAWALRQQMESEP